MRAFIIGRHSATATRAKRERERETHTASQPASYREHQRTQDGWVVCSRSWSRSKSRSQSRSLSRFIVHADIRVPSIHPSISTLLENDEKLDGRYTVLTIIDRVPSFVMQAWFNKYVPGDHCTPDAVQITVLSGSATPDTQILTKQLPVCALLCGTRCPRRILLVPVPKKQFKQIDFETCAILNLGLSSNATFK